MVADFKKWGFHIIPHRARVKQGFEVGRKESGRGNRVQRPEVSLPRRNRLCHVADGI